MKGDRALDSIARLLGFALLTAVLVLGPMGCLHRQHRPVLRQDEGMELHISLPQSQFILGEPFVVTASLVNVCSTSLHVKDSRWPLIYGHLTFQFTYPDGEKIRYVSCVDGMSVVSPGDTGSVLTPGDSLYIRVAPLIGGARIEGKEGPDRFKEGRRNGYMCPEPGAYKIKGLYTFYGGSAVLWNGHIESNVLTMTIDAPQGKDVEALSAWEEGWDQFGLREPEGLKRTFEQYPRSTYAKYARYRYWYYGGGDYRRAIEELSQLLEGEPDFPCREEIQFWIARCYAKSGEREKANDIIRAVRKKYPGNTLIRWESRSLKEVYHLTDVD